MQEDKIDRRLLLPATNLHKPTRVSEQQLPEGTSPAVSICCLAYNHENYIRDAIEGFLMQETTFPVEILLHDDASTDRTSEIIREYETRYPRLIKPVYQTINQHSGGGRPGKKTRERAIGDYIAVCEGDDFWTDPKKLQIQWEHLESDNRCDMCFHLANKLNFENGETIQIGGYRNKNGIVPSEEIITKSHGLIATASLFYRRKVIHDLHRFIDENPYVTIGDVYVHFWGSIRGGAFYINRNMATYRFRTPGSWSKSCSEAVDFKKQHVIAKIRSFEVLGAVDDRKHESSLLKSNRKLIFAMIGNPSVKPADARELLRISSGSFQRHRAAWLICLLISRAPPVRAVFLFIFQKILRKF